MLPDDKDTKSLSDSPVKNSPVVSVGLSLSSSSSSDVSDLLWCLSEGFFLLLFWYPCLEETLLLEDFRPEFLDAFRDTGRELLMS